VSTLTYHRKPNGATYVYRQKSYWDKSKGRSATSQVCIGKLDADGKIIYNKRFSDQAARDSLEKGETVSESVTTGQSLVLERATEQIGLGRVLRSSLGTKTADMFISLAWAVTALDGTMSHASVWIEQNECPAHDEAPSSQGISRILHSVTQGQIDGFLKAWMSHRDKGGREQYCFDVTSVSSHNKSNPFVEYGHNRDGESLAQINLALLTGVASRIPTYYEVLPGSMADVKAIRVFSERMKKYGVGHVRMLLDRGFYSAANLKCMLGNRMGFIIPMPSNVKTAQELIDKNRDSVESPEHIIVLSEDARDAVYGMTALGEIDGRRVWYHIYYDTARRSEHLLSFYASLNAWEAELLSGELKESNEWAYKRYFTVKNTPKRGRRVMRNQEAVNVYKTDRAGYWVIVTNREKEASAALSAYRERSLIEVQFDDMKNELDLERLRTHGQDTMRGRVFVQFLALIICSQIRVTVASAWNKRNELQKDIRLSRHYSLCELMLRMGSYRKTRFSGRYGEAISTPTKAQREIFHAFGIERPST
jgi:transposase